MSDSSDQAKFAAHAFLVQWQSDTGEQLGAVLSDRMLFAYEMGYLRGRGDAHRDTIKMFEESSKKGDAPK
jgi:hypothetical protein